MKVLWMLGAVVAMLWLIRGLRRRTRVSRSSAPGAPLEALPPVRMVSCAHCGVHLPQAEAWIADGRPYCGPAHRDAGKA